MAAVRYLLIGGGLASATAAEQIRKRDPGGTITIVGAEPHLPYHRPPLSKEYLRGEAQVADTLIQPESFYAENGIALRRGARVTALDTNARSATLDTGEQIAYEKALIATGAEPRRLSAPGADLPGLHLLRTIDDSSAIRGAIERGATRVLIVGGGYIGVEVAGDCLQKGLQVTIVEPLSQLWGRFAGPGVAGFLAEAFRERGAELLLGEEIVAFEGDGRVRAGRTKSGRELPCDVAVVGIGVTPRVDLAKAAGLAVDERQGIRVNEFMETSAPNVWAAGDATCFHDPVYGRDWHVEHWNNAFWHGEVAGANMAGERQAYDHVPNFFSEVLGLHMELFGDPVEWKRTLLTGDRAAQQFAELYLDASDAVQMVIAFNPPEEQLEALEQIARRRPSVRGRETEIHQPGFDLRSLL